MANETFLSEKDFADFEKKVTDAANAILTKNKAVGDVPGLTGKAASDKSIIETLTNGISPENMLTIINEGALGNGLSKLKTSAILQEQFPAAFALKHLVKDLGLAKDAGLESKLSNPLINSFQQAYDQGLGEEDVMAIIKSINI